jgi:hypothetical protein
MTGSAAYFEEPRQLYVRTLPRPPILKEKTLQRHHIFSALVSRMPSKVKRFVGKEGMGDFFLDFGF